ncbi:hypothetical protein GBAR_LOCUS7009 [Geodia barretti]|uniref:Uncharacterized protein n=1 Tax=Geodia barretti TaxID=519541 RepID=A0AA35RGB6_GEOBA|nr:hypothetical protein GBAR_LOCUS7009 [Geodia barretti]
MQTSGLRREVLSAASPWLPELSRSPTAPLPLPQGRQLDQSRVCEPVSMTSPLIALLSSRRAAPVPTQHGPAEYPPRTSTSRGDELARCTQDRSLRR